VTQDKNIAAKYPNVLFLSVSVHWIGINNILFLCVKSFFFILIFVATLSRIDYIFK